MAILENKNLLVLKFFPYRYLTGLQKLSESEQMITDLQEELKSLQPRLVKTSANTEALMIKIEQDTVQVEKKKEVGHAGIVWITFMLLSAYYIKFCFQRESPDRA